MNYRVVQTVEAFKYLKGTIWGPYTKRKDAEERVQILMKYDGSGLITEGEFGKPCSAVRPAYEDGTEEV